MDGSIVGRRPHPVDDHQLDATIRITRDKPTGAGLPRFELGMLRL
ncbi:hypothetical protein [Dyella sp. C9]|nr:hypothetical protein [Dyella sp. C9]